MTDFGFIVELALKWRHSECGSCDGSNASMPLAAESYAGKDSVPAKSLSGWQDWSEEDPDDELEVLRLRLRAKRKMKK